MSTIAKTNSLRIEDMVCEDRISALPEDLLLQILMLIPTKEAVATMILSKSWRFIWTMLPTLDYKENNDYNDHDIEYYYDDDDDDDNDGHYDENQKSVWWFLNKSLEIHKAPVLETLRIKLGPQCPTDANVGKWVANAVGRGLRMLRLKLGWSADPTRLPKSLYTCEPLKALTLSHKILVDFPSSSWLPSLTFLELLYVTYKDDASLVRFLSSCPILENLGVKRKKDDNVAKFRMKVPSLLLLWYEDINSSLADDNDDVVDTGRFLVIDTPSLENFEFINYSGDSWSIEYMPCLKDAYIDVNSFPDIDKFLTSLSSVLSLELRLATDEMIMRCSTIIFSRLTKCKISPCDSEWMDSLVPLLQNTPKLKSFIVDYRSTHQPPVASASWTKLAYYYPECLSSSLEKFELIDYGGRIEEQELVEYILTFACCLKTATISLRPALEPEEKETIMEDLKAMPRFSITSQLLLQTT